MKALISARRDPTLRTTVHVTDFPRAMRGLRAYEEQVVDTLATHRKALNVQVLESEVVLSGPRVAVALTADAAAETAKRLADAAAIAASAVEQPPQASQTLSSEE